LKIFKNVNYKGGAEEMDMNLSTTALNENYLKMFIDTFTEALHQHAGKPSKL
jgi:hypothetical protein